MVLTDKDNMAYQQSLERMAVIRTKQDELKLEYSQLEAEFLKMATVDLEDTKLKSVTYSSTSADLTATLASKLKVEAPTFLKSVFGKAYSDYVTESTDYKLSASATRLLIGLWSDDYIRSTIPEIVEQLDISDIQKKTLLKKLKGANFNTDKKNLVEIGELAEDEAETLAYFVTEAAIWEQFLRLLKLNGRTPEDGADDILDHIDGAVIVEHTPRLTLTTRG